MSIMDIYGIDPYAGPGGIDAALPDFDLSIPPGVPGMTAPAINFKNAPVNFMLRENNPRVFDPLVNIKNFAQNFPSNVGSGITSVTDKGINLGKAAIGGIASLVTGIPGIGLLLNAFGPMTEEEKAMRDFYGSEFGLDDIGRVQSGIMKGYNPVSMFGGPGLSKSIDKRISTIQKTLKKKKSDTLQKRLQALEALRQKEEQARDRDRAARARARFRTGHAA